MIKCRNKCTTLNECTKTLKEAKEGIWQDIDYRIVDYDGIVEKKSGDQKNIWLAEIKRNFFEKHIEKLLNNLSALQKSFNKVKETDRSIKRINIEGIEVLSFHSGEGKVELWKNLKHALTSKRYVEPIIYDLESIKEGCEEQISSGHSLLKSIEIIEKSAYSNDNTSTNY